MTAGATIIKNILPDLAKAFVKQYVDIDAVTDTVKNTIKSSADLLYESVEEYTKKKEGIEDFKKQLGEYLGNGEFKHPVVFIIDELDRCRPDYAVEFLEKIKHFFSVEGIVFVLALDKKQIGNSIKGFYGSDLIDSEEYLRRFIDIEYRLPQPEFKDYCDYLYKYFGFDEFFSPRERLSSFSGESDFFLTTAAAFAIKYNLTLRQIEKLFAHSCLVLKSFSQTHYLVPYLFFILIFLRDQHPEMYGKLQSKEYTYTDLVDGMFEIVDALHVHNKTYYIAQIFTFYATYCNQNASSYFDEVTNSLSFELNTIHHQDFINALHEVRRNNYRGDILKHLFLKIELYSNLV
jgi:hypothetical protein